MIRVALLLLGIVVAFGACGARGNADADPLAGETIVAIWNEATLEGIREGGLPAPIAARALAIADTSMYDAWAAYDPIAVGTDATSRLRRPASERTKANTERAIAVAAYYALRDVIPIPVADVTLSQTGQRIGRGDRPERVGRAAAAAVLAFRHRDGSNQLGDMHPGAYTDYTGYHPENSPTRIANPDHWQPLPVYDGVGRFVPQHFVVPQWGRVTPFAFDPAIVAAEFPRPATAGDPRYRQEAADLVAISAQLSDRQKVQAEYWADGMMTDSPPGHWARFGIWVSKRDHHDAATDARMFFALSNALLDASIVCWNVKRRDDSVRPITAIHFLFRGQKIAAWAGPGKRTAMIDGASWQPYQPIEVVTPAFPEYFSGHSTFSAAAAEVLRRFTGSDHFGFSYVQRARSSIVEPGVPAQPVTLTWATFSDAADSAGMSRRYGGIHFEDGDLYGRAAGRMVGTATYAKAAALFGGSKKAPSPRAND